MPFRTLLCSAPCWLPASHVRPTEIRGARLPIRQRRSSGRGPPSNPDDVSHEGDRAPMFSYLGTDGDWHRFLRSPRARLDPDRLRRRTTRTCGRSRKPARRSRTWDHAGDHGGHAGRLGRAPRATSTAHLSVVSGPDAPRSRPVQQPGSKQASGTHLRSSWWMPRRLIRALGRGPLPSPFGCWPRARGSGRPLPPSSP